MSDRRGLFLILTILVIFTVVNKTSTESAKQDIKNQINTVVRQQCLANASSSVYAKYNDLVQANIDQQETAAKLNRKEGKVAKVAADLAFAARFKADKLPIPSPKQLAALCAKPLLK